VPADRRFALRGCRWSKVSLTMEVYAHVLPDVQQKAAATLAAVLQGL
jgi:hypothetical protein